MENWTDSCKIKKNRREHHPKEDRKRKNLTSQFLMVSLYSINVMLLWYLWILNHKLISSSPKKEQKTSNL